MQEVDDIIEMFPGEENDEGSRRSPEEANDKDLRIAKSRPMRQNAGTVVDLLVMSFGGNTYNSGKQLFMRARDSKNGTYYFIKLATIIVFTPMSAKDGIKNLD